MSPKLDLRDQILTSKEVCFTLGWSRTTLWRRKKEGCPFVGRRVGAMRLAWWLEQRDAARELRMSLETFLKLPRRRRERLMQQLNESKGRRKN